MRTATINIYTSGKSIYSGGTVKWQIGLKIAKNKYQRRPALGSHTIFSIFSFSREIRAYAFSRNQTQNLRPCTLHPLAIQHKVTYDLAAEILL
jgi:hypothetical protein